MANRTLLRRFLLWLLPLAAEAAAAAALPPPWPYTTDFDSYLLHVHPEVNYALPPQWLDVWERERLRAGCLRAVFGSSATDELLIDARWALNHELTCDLRLRQDIVWQERRHLPLDRLDIWLGLEQRVWRRLAVVVQTVLAERKEAIDLRLGWLWTSADRTRYAQLLYVLEDLIHDQKDGRGGVTETSPIGANWLARFERGPWALFTQGNWVRGFARRYPDSGRSPELVAHARMANELSVRLSWRPLADRGVEAAWFQAEDAERMEFREGPFASGMSAFSYHYAGWYRLISLRGMHPLADRWRLRAECHQLHRRAAATGWRAFTYDRDEIMPAVFAEWAWSRRRAVELGYLGTFYRWRHRDHDRRLIPDTRRGFADKVELALILGLAGQAALKLSVSHEVSLERFGGGSVRLLADF